MLEATPSNAAGLAHAYRVDCHSCAGSFDAMTAPWCSCIVKERSLVCPSCERCFCRALNDYKRRFWTDAPDLLWQRKQAYARERSLLAPNPPPQSVARPLVLVVDDDREVCAYACHLIESWGLGVIHAVNGAEALELAHAYRPEVILTDALMPRMDGRELCRRIKEDPGLASTRVIVMTSVYTSGRFKRETLSHFRADAFIDKPVDPAVAQRSILVPVLESHDIAPRDLSPLSPAPAKPPSLVVSSDGISADDPIAPLLGVTSSVEEVTPAAPSPAAVPAAFDSASATRTDAASTPSPESESGTVFPQLLMSLEELLSENGVLATIDDPGPDAGEPAAAGPSAPLEDLLFFEPETREGEERADDGAAPAAVPTATELIYLQAVGLDAELPTLRGPGVHMAPGELLSLSAAGIPRHYVEAVCAGFTGATARDVIALHAAGVETRAIPRYAMLGIGAQYVAALTAAQVALEFIEDVCEVSGRPLTPPEIMRLHAVGVDLRFLRALHAHGYGEEGPDGWIRLRAAGVTAEFIEAAQALRERPSLLDLVRLRITGVDVAVLGRLGGLAT